MKVITIGNVKGGVGKTTIADNLAVFAVKKGKKAILVDADVQGSTMGFRNLRESDDVQAVSITTPTLHKDISAFSKSHDLVIIDAGGRDSATFRSAIMACDLLVIPCIASLYDLLATADTLSLLRDCRAIKDVRAQLLLNQLQANTLMARDAEDTLQEMAIESDCPVLNSKLYHRAVYKNAIVTGKGVCEYESKGKAAQEIEALYNELMTITSKKRGK